MINRVAHLFSLVGKFPSSVKNAYTRRGKGLSGEQNYPKAASYSSLAGCRILKFHFVLQFHDNAVEKLVPSVLSRNLSVSHDRGYQNKRTVQLSARAMDGPDPPVCTYRWGMRGVHESVLGYFGSPERPLSRLV